MKPIPPPATPRRTNQQLSRMLSDRLDKIISLANECEGLMKEAALETTGTNARCSALRGAASHIGYFIAQHQCKCGAFRWRRA